MSFRRRLVGSSSMQGELVLSRHGRAAKHTMLGTDCTNCTYSPKKKPYEKTLP